MHSSKLVGIAALIMVAVPFAASADSAYQGAWRYEPSNRHLPQNQQPQSEPRYQAHNKLAEIVVSPHEARDLIRIPAHQPRLDYLELRAIGGPVTIRDVAVRLADGQVIHTGSRGVIAPGQGRVIDLPRGSAPVVAVMPLYGYRRAWSGGYHQSAVRLELFAVAEHHRRGYDRSYRQDAGYGYAQY